MANRQRPGKRITSGDKVVDWIFSRVIYALNHKIEAILLKKDLQEKHRGKTSNFYGYLDGDVISLNASKIFHLNREAIAKTLLHEAMHSAFCCIYERDIRRLEDLVWEKLSKDQRSLLKSYIPKHKVKRSYTA